MNELGMILVWQAVQVTLVAVPALALHALASRRGPASGAWVAGLSLALVVALSGSAGIPRAGRSEAPLARGASPAAAAGAAAARSAAPRQSTGGRRLGHERGHPPEGAGWELAGLRIAWARLARGAAEPAERCRPWGHWLAVVGLAGSGLGLLRLIAGLWAVRCFRRQTLAVVDPKMNGLLDELRREMGYRRSIDLREVRGLTTPATAGCWRPVLLLPDDWGSWTHSERRAVLAHELAHMVRGDYAAGLLARLAVVLNFYHPLVRWIAGRLQLQQEQAADALAARFAGGRADYLRALARLALTQDGRSPSWPARAFLPARGTLIRRITMLQDHQDTPALDRPLSGAWRPLTSAALVGLTVGVTLLRGPARADDPAARATAAAAPDLKPAGPAADAPFTPLYVRDGMAGLVAFRPAATLRRTGLVGVVPGLSDLLNAELAELSGDLRVDTSRPGFLALGCEEIEWVTCGIGFGHATNPERNDLHTILFGGLTVRAVAPFDWLAFFRQWRIGFDEVHEGGRHYFKVTGPLKPIVGPDACVFLPDDRTLVLEQEKEIRALLRRELPAAPAYLMGPDWDRVSRGLLAVVIDNRDGRMARLYDLGRPDDAIVLSLFQGVDRWTFGIDGAEALALQATAACRDSQATAGITRTIASLRMQGQGAIEQVAPEARGVGGHDRWLDVARALLANLRVEPADRSVLVRAEGLGTLAQFAAIIEGEVKEARTPNPAGDAPLRGAKP